MSRTKRLLLRIACCIAIACCALLLLQSAGIVPPLGIGWGDGVRGRGYDAGFDGAMIFRTANGMKQPTIGGATFGVRTLGRFDIVGVHYHRWNMILEKHGNTLPGDLGTWAEVRIGLGSSLLILLAAIVACRWLLVQERRRWLASRANLCANCGYDLRATPDRCPECGLVSSAGAVVRPPADVPGGTLPGT